VQVLLVRYMRLLSCEPANHAGVQPAGWSAGCLLGLVGTLASGHAVVQVTCLLYRRLLFWPAVSLLVLVGTVSTEHTVVQVTWLLYRRLLLCEHSIRAGVLLSGWPAVSLLVLMGTVSPEHTVPAGPGGSCVPAGPGGSCVPRAPEVGGMVGRYG